MQTYSESSQTEIQKWYIPWYVDSTSFSSIQVLNFWIEFPILTTYTSLEFLHFWIPVERLDIFVSQVSVPTSLSIFQLSFESLSEEVFKKQYQTIWKTIDTIFSNSRLKRLHYFVIWTKSKQVYNFQDERNSILDKIFPKLIKKNNLWWGDCDSKIGILFIINYLNLKF